MSILHMAIFVYMTTQHMFAFQMTSNQRSNALYNTLKDAHGVMVIVIHFGCRDTSSNPGQGCLHFTQC